MVKERHADHVWPWNMVKLGFLYFYEYYCSRKQDLLIVDTKSFFHYKVQSLNTK